MKRGYKVRCVDRGDSEYLTEGKEYTVAAGDGDANQFGWVLEEGSIGFDVVDDEGDVISCRTVGCGHATRELVG